VRSVDHRWRSLDRRTTTGGEWETRRRSADRLLDSPEPQSKRVATRMRSADPRSSPDPRGLDRADPDVPHRSDDEERSTEDLTLDIDSALAEVMSEIESLGLGRVVFEEDKEIHTEKFTMSTSPSADRKNLHTIDVKRCFLLFRLVTFFTYLTFFYFFK